jgi:hypothetical protein
MLRSLLLHHCCVVETSQERRVTILWNQQVQTHRTITNNKPDIIIRVNEKGTCVLIELQFREREREL